jgi:hypothetical protein
MEINHLVSLFHFSAFLFLPPLLLFSFLQGHPEANILYSTYAEVLQIR